MTYLLCWLASHLELSDALRVVFFLFRFGACNFLYQRAGLWQPLPQGVRTVVVFSPTLRSQGPLPANVPVNSEPFVDPGGLFNHCFFLEGHEALVGAEPPIRLKTAR